MVKQRCSTGELVFNATFNTFNTRCDHAHGELENEPARRAVQVAGDLDLLHLLSLVVGGSQLACAPGLINRCERQHCATLHARSHISQDGFVNIDDWR